MNLRATQAPLAWGAMGFAMGIGMRALVLLLALAPTACNKDASNGACTTDAECPLPGTRCGPSQQCICMRDEACGTGFFCNRAGVCQGLAGCINNSECPEPNTFCDLASGQCLSGPALMLSSSCGLSSHCPFGTVCREGTCQAGCYDDGDCPLGQLCYNGLCSTGDGLCGSDQFCDYGELCSADTEPKTCKQDNRGPYCQGCSPRTTANPAPCGQPRNFCLINTLESNGFRSYCGVDCSLGQPCPNGYGCNGVVILTQDVCTFEAQCRCDPALVRYATATCTVAASCDPRLPDGAPDTDATACTFPGEPACNGGVEGGSAACLVPRGESTGNCTCATDADCGAGGVCVAGLCCSGEVRDDRSCSIGENRVSGFCTCATDNDCPRDVCDSGRRVCAITGLPCTPGADDCGPIPCVDGGCLIGQNCAPIQGLSCSVLGTR